MEAEGQTQLDRESVVYRRAMGGGSERALGPDDYDDLLNAALEDINRPGLKRRLAERFGPKGDGKSTDDPASKLDRSAQRDLVKKVMETGGGSNEALARKVRERFNRVGMAMPSVEVRFKDLTLSSVVPEGSTKGLFTVGKDIKVKILKTLGMLTFRKPLMREIKIVSGVSGVLKPGTLTLLLGPPSGGKSLLLKALCDKAGVRRSGEVTYNGHNFHEFNVTRTARYISQNNVLNPQLTVRETLAFSEKCQGAGYRPSLVSVLEEKEAAMGIQPDPDVVRFMRDLTDGKSGLSTELTLQLLSLVNCADTIVGDGQMRGVSGGEKKRVTTGEMVVGPSKVLFMDEISTGLDSASTYTIVQSLRNWAHGTNSTIVVALLQPEPQTYDLFDDIMVLAEGRLMFHGPRTEVPDYFAGLGFECTEHKAVADFLQEIVSRKDQPVLRKDPTKFRPDLGFVPASAFAEAFERSPGHQSTLEYLATPYDKTRSHPAALMKSKYGCTGWDAFKALTWRETILLKRNRRGQFYRYFQMVVLSTVCATLFLRNYVSNNRSLRGLSNAWGAIFFSVAYNQFLGLADCAAQLQRLPVFFKQRANLFYPGWAFAVPLTLVNIPIQALESTYWTIVVYWVVGLQANAGRFFTFWATMVLLQIYSSSLYRLIGSAVRAMVTGVTISVLVMFLTLLGSGFVILKPQIPPWAIWLYWLSPLQYTLTGLANNEFGGSSYDSPYPFNPSQTLGQAFLTQFGVPQGNFYRWLAPVLLFSWAVVFNLLHMLVLTVLPPPRGPPPTPPPHALNPHPEDGVAAAGEEHAPHVAVEIADVRKHGGDVSTGSSDDSGPAGGIVGEQDGAQGKGGSMLTMSFVPVTLAFADIHYHVPNPKGSGELELLKGISGIFRPGVLTALMGSSGAGKSTLMDVLTDRKTVGRITGKVTVNGFEKNADDFARISGYCEQFDTHSPGTTVEEAVRFSATLRLSRSIDAQQREAFVGQTMDIVELHPIAHAIVGMPGSYGLSGEQFKRLTIAVELVANPSIMFMDEPTSGLDARAAQIVMRVVRNIVNSNRTIVCTIHQPSAEIFFSFDEVLLLKRGGWTIYYGPLSSLVDYFQSIPGVKKMPELYNPATYMLEVSTQSEEERLGINFADVYTERLLPDMQRQVEQCLTPKEGAVEMKRESSYAAGFATQYQQLLMRNSRSYWRNPPYNSTRLLLTVLAGLIAGAVYWSLGDNYGSINNVVTIAGALFISIVFLGSKNLQMVIPVFLFERPVFYRERAARMYSVFAWVEATIDAELPWITVQAIVFSCIIYFMIHFQVDAARFFFFMLVVWVTLGIYTYLGMMCVALTPNVVMGVTLGAMLQGLWIMFAGFLIPKPAMPSWWFWFYYTSPMAWAIYALVADQLGDKGTGYEITLPDGTVTNIAAYVDATYDYKYHLRWMAVGILFFCLILLRFALVAAVRFLNYQNR